MIERIGNYRITDEIGSGGMAVVYKGIQESLQRTVAIKALKTSVSNDKDVVARFEREATSIASFQHENIITVYDFFRERGALFIVMEYVEGIDLYDLIDRCGQLPCDIAAIISLQVARALDYAHFSAVIHRDVKPANIIISKLGTVKLTDFGIARVEESDLTEFGVGLGTPAYMSPEQALGGRLDHRSDIFSLGIVMYQMVTGNKPFQDDTERSAMEKIRTDQPPPPHRLNKTVPRGFEEIIFRCMEKAPEDRHGSTQELVVQLEQYLAATVNQNYRARLLMYLKELEVVSHDETQATLHPAMIGEYMGKVPLLKLRRRTRRAILAMLVILVLALPAGALIYWRFLKEPPPRMSVAVQPCTPVPGKAELGYLRVVASPWATVSINGEQVATTPFDQPLPVEPGVHKVKLSNPYFETIEREVKVERDKVVTLEEILTRSGAPPGDAAVKPATKPANGAP